MSTRVIYLMNVSIDGFINDEDGSPNWVDVDEEIHSWFNDQAREAAAFIYGRRLYETMAAYWPTALEDPDATPAMVEFARIWQPKPKLVFSRTLREVASNSRLITMDIVDALPQIKAEFDGDLEVGGATLVAGLVERNLVDVYRLVVHPVILGRGTPYLARSAGQLRLRLTDSHKFANGAVLLNYERR